MGDIRKPLPVLPFVAVFTHCDEGIRWAREKIEQHWGRVVLESEAFPFEQTTYYEPTMGPHLRKIFFAFEPLIDPGQLVEMKHQSNAWEEEFARISDAPEVRPLNIDPGYVDLGKVVLATTKDFAHRIYMNRGIYAEVTLTFVRGTWHDHPWTFPDYRETTYHPFFNACRNRIFEARKPPKVPKFPKLRRKTMNIDEFRTIRERWGNKLLILGHYYIPDDTLALTDRQGDSLALSQIAAADDTCEALIFCGVHFMAETADILVNSPEKIANRGGLRIPVLLPDPHAGCPMADMATRVDVESCWNQLAEIMDMNEVTPITYVNSSAAVKAFCGQHGGIVCTSSNARKVLDFALSRRPRVLFMPDQHLGRNTALAMGIDPAKIVQWNRLEGVRNADLRCAKIILWDGYCPIHNAMSPELAKEMCAETPEARLVVHPECRQELVSQSASAGSTSFLIKEIQNAAPGTSFIVGTESHLVERLKSEHADLEIRHLGGPHVCEDMERNTLPALFDTLAQLETRQYRNLVRVSEDVASFARIALENMLSLG